jgi:hypothetical protein
MIVHTRFVLLLALPGVLAAGLHEWLALWLSRRREARNRPADRFFGSDRRPSR